MIIRLALVMSLFIDINYYYIYIYVKIINLFQVIYNLSCILF